MKPIAAQRDSRAVATQPAAKIPTARPTRALARAPELPSSISRAVANLHGSAVTPDTSPAPDSSRWLEIPHPPLQHAFTCASGGGRGELLSADKPSYTPNGHNIHTTFHSPGAIRQSEHPRMAPSRTAKRRRHPAALAPDLDRIERSYEAPPIPSTYGPLAHSQQACRSAGELIILRMLTCEHARPLSSRRCRDRQPQQGGKKLSSTCRMPIVYCRARSLRGRLATRRSLSPRTARRYVARGPMSSLFSLLPASKT